MRSSLVNTTLKTLFPLKRTVAIEGAPGGGKTTVVHQVAKALKVPVIERHMPTMLVEDFGVLYPTADSATLEYKIPSWFPAEGTDHPDKGILLFDDRNQASPDLQKVLANICQARNLHGHPLKKGWMVISTGNRQSDRAGANRVLSHLRNRETVVEFETNLDDWCEWAMANKIKPELVAFIRFRPNLLHDFDPQRDANPTPRSWAEGVSALMGVVPAEAEFEVFKGAVGEGAASEFMGFLRVYRDLPDIDKLLEAPSKASVPTDPTVLYAISAALANRTTVDNIEAVLEYMGRLPAEFGVLAVTMALRTVPKIQGTKAFGKWASANHKLLF